MSSNKTYDAGVKDYRETYWMPDYTPADTDILACFKITPHRRFYWNSFVVLQIVNQAALWLLATFRIERTAGHMLLPCRRH